MNFQIIEGRGKFPIKAWINGVSIEDEARAQLLNTSAMPFVKGLAVMPDVHWGMGSTVGSVIVTEKAVIPASVGVDIGCGMIAVQTSLTASDLPDSLAEMRSAIEAAVPHGRTDNGGVNDRGAWGDPKHEMPEALVDGLGEIQDKQPKLGRAAHRAAHHLGTLGSGNHFIEVCLDADQRVWVMLHSGSRGIGNAIGSRYIELAKEEMRHWHINLPDDNLAYLPEGSTYFWDYCNAVRWAQNFAAHNRECMMKATIDAIQATLGRAFEWGEVAVNCHHNYISQERCCGGMNWVTRKGAVRAGKGQLGIIPGSMGARSYIVRGKGSADSFESCSHGAGRAMSRRKAAETFTLADHEAATAGVECRKDQGVIDETPGAYKPIDAVMAAQTDLVEVVATLKQVLCVKG